MSNVDLIRTAEAKEIIGCSTATVNRLAKSGALAVAAEGDGIRGVRFFHRADVEALAAARSEKAS